MKFFAKEIAKSGYVFRMEHAGFMASLMCAPRLEDTGRACDLPPGEPIPVFPLAALPGAPEGWVREVGSYVCPVDADWGLWFDWTMNDKMNTAVVPSVKGMNPITGQKLEGLSLSEYSDKCPVHGEPFTHGNFCEKCGYDWPPQNYICAPNTLWWDGFRQPDGKVRQFFFTADESRDVASLVIGKENTVPAFGFGFFRPKNPRTAPKTTYRSSVMDFGESSFGSFCNAGDVVYGCSNSTLDYSEPDGLCMSCLDGAEVASKGITRGFVNSQSVRKQPVASVSVGAGAEISQELNRDSLGVDGWQPEAAATIRLYFCFREQFMSIVNNGGVKTFSSDPAGFMKNVPVG